MSHDTDDFSHRHGPTSRMLWDRWPSLPFHAVAPWPHIEDPRHLGQGDWVNQVNTVESWLDQYIGRHYVDWTWDMWSLKQAFYCGVAFRESRSVTLFLLRFGSVAPT